MSHASQAGNAGVSLYRGMPPHARSLVWDVFYASRGRGVGFEAHMPWADDPRTLCFVMEERACGGATIAAATLVARPAPIAETAMIGLVCVRDRDRGTGLSTTLLNAADQALKAEGFNASLLWTGKPGVYERAGFAVICQDVLIEASIRRSETRSGGDPAERPWPSTWGLPAFARSGKIVSDGAAELAYVEGDQGATLLDRQGEATDAVRLMIATGVERWLVSVVAGDPMEQLLRDGGFSLTVRPGSFTMVRPAHFSGVSHVVPVDRI